MDPAQFSEECQRLARPRLDLRRRDQVGEVAGVWGGPGPLPAPRGDWRHWITVSCGWLGRHGFQLSGLLGVYENRADGAFHDFAAVLSEPAGTVAWGGGVELF